MGRTVGQTMTRAVVAQMSSREVTCMASSVFVCRSLGALVASSLSCCCGTVMATYASFVCTGQCNGYSHYRHSMFVPLLDIC